MVKGQLKYVPKEFIEELEYIKFDFGLKKDSDCFRILAKTSRLGREMRIQLDNRRK